MLSAPEFDPDQDLVKHVTHLASTLPRANVAVLTCQHFDQQGCDAAYVHQSDKFRRFHPWPSDWDAAVLDVGAVWDLPPQLLELLPAEILRIHLGREEECAWRDVSGT